MSRKNSTASNPGVSNANLMADPTPVRNNMSRKNSTASNPNVPNANLMEAGEVMVQGKSRIFGLTNRQENRRNTLKNIRNRIAAKKNANFKNSMTRNVTLKNRTNNSKNRSFLQKTANFFRYGTQTRKQAAKGDDILLSVKPKLNSYAQELFNYKVKATNYPDDDEYDYSNIPLPPNRSLAERMVTVSGY